MKKKAGKFERRRLAAIQRCEFYIQRHAEEMMLLAAAKRALQADYVTIDRLQDMERIALVTDWRQR